MIRATFLAAVALLAPVFAFAAPEDEVREAEMAWVAAVKANDFAKLESLLSPDLIYTHSTGVIEDKGAYLKALKSGNQKYDEIAHSNLRVKAYGGDSGVVTAKVRMAGKSKGTPFDNQLLMMHVWVKQGGRWQLAAHQTTRLQ
jgi:ketosteroid isomerase-like protein